MVEFFFKRLSVFLLLVAFVVGIFLVVGNAGKNLGNFDSVFNNADVITGFVVHPSYPSFSLPEAGFVFNNNTRLVSVSDSIVYKTGYYSINGGSWTNFTFSGSAYGTSTVWLTGTATKTLPSFGVGEHYVIVYSCKYNSAWDCYGGRWQLLVVNNSPVVVPPVSTCNDGKQNQGETGVDCGGPCVACSNPTNYLRTFYVSSSSGNDANSGTSASSPWKTISKVNSYSFLPGDGILFKSGDTWREPLTIHNSGTSNARITYSSYGAGNKPLLLGSTKASTWTSVSGNIWVSGTTHADASSIVFDQSGIITWGNEKKVYQAGFGNLNAEYDWTWNNNKIYVYAATNPDIRYSSVEVFNPSTSYFGITSDAKEYFTIDGLDVRYWYGNGIAEKWHSSMPHLHGFIVKNCDISYIGNLYLDYGFGIQNVHSDSYYGNNIIHDCGRRGLSLNDYQAGTGLLIENIIIENNTFFNGAHTTSIDIIAHGEQKSTINNITIRKNLIYESPARSSTFADTLLFVSKQGAAGGSVISNVYIYDNIFRYPSGVGIHLENNKGTYIYNNVFYGTNPVSTQVSSGYKIALEGDETSNVYMKNNIFYGMANAPAISVNPAISGTVISDYNLFYNTNPSSNIVRWLNGYYTSAQWTSYKTATGQDAHSPTPSNPLFVDAANNNFHLQTGSPAISKGVAIQGITNDYEGLSYKNPPSIGAFEYK